MKHSAPLCLALLAAFVGGCSKSMQQAEAVEYRNEIARLFKEKGTHRFWDEVVENRLTKIDPLGMNLKTRIYSPAKPLDAEGDEFILPWVSVRRFLVVEEDSMTEVAVIAHPGAVWRTYDVRKKYWRRADDHGMMVSFAAYDDAMRFCHLVTYEAELKGDQSFTGPSTCYTRGRIHSRFHALTDKIGSPFAPGILCRSARKRVDHRLIRDTHQSPPP